MVMKTLSNFISVHQRREEQGVTHWWIIELLGLVSAAGGLYPSEGSREIPSRWGSVLHLLL